jgi:hypothetical protein
MISPTLLQHQPMWLLPVGDGLQNTITPIGTQQVVRNGVDLDCSSTTL